jgi:predicted nuclease with TOPRIM domain
MEDWQRRMEAKMDRLSEAVVQLARIEERMTTLLDRVERSASKQDELERKIHVLESINTERGTILYGVTKVFWLVVAALISFLVWIFKDAS